MSMNKFELVSGLAALTAVGGVDTTNMTDGSANNTLSNLTAGTYDATQIGNIEKNFDILADEINAIVADLTAIRNALNTAN